MVIEQRHFKHCSLKNNEFKYFPVNRRDLTRGRCKCSRCGEFANVFYYKFFPHENIHYSVCVACVLELDPPKLELMLATTSRIENSIVPVGSYNIWDSTNSRQELSMSIKEFTECGWFIRKLKEERQKVPKRTILTVNLEYHGNLICGRAMSHYEKLGLEDMNRCNSPFCDFVYVQHINLM